MRDANTSNHRLQKEICIRTISLNVSLLEIGLFLGLRTYQEVLTRELKVLLLINEILSQIMVFVRQRERDLATEAAHHKLPCSILRCLKLSQALVRSALCVVVLI
jgi:hypothetical protein